MAIRNNYKNEKSLQYNQNFLFARMVYTIKESISHNSLIMNLNDNDFIDIINYGLNSWNSSNNNYDGENILFEN